MNSVNLRLPGNKEMLGFLLWAVVTIRRSSGCQQGASKRRLNQGSVIFASEQPQIRGIGHSLKGNRENNRPVKSMGKNVFGDIKHTKSRDGLQNNWSSFLKSVEGYRVKDRLKNSPRLKETKKT